MNTSLVLGTAGHVDHGKTALVLALTGRDTDRLPEEKARGISIALGFAPLTLPSGRRLSLVDVPGHERFVRHMVAGASGIDGYLLCVAADDGVMPQTVEHMAVFRLLGIDDGVVAITKSDMSDPDAATAQVRDLVGDGPAVVAVSAITGDGVAALRAQLDALASRLARRTAAGPPRLFIDRSFSVPGAGTVVTGALWGASLDAGQTVTIIPGERAARIRGIEVHDEGVDAAEGGRVALNLAGIERGDAPRGAIVVRAADRWARTSMLDVSLDWLPDAGGPLRTRRRLQAFLGTAELGATCVLLEHDALEPGGRGYAQLRLDGVVVAAPGDRLVLRSAARRTVGGATVIDPAPARHGRGSPAARMLGALASGDTVALLAMRLGEAGTAGVEVDAASAVLVADAGGDLLVADLAFASPVVAAAEAAVLEVVAGGAIADASALAATGLPPGAAAALLDRLEQRAAVVRGNGRVRLPGQIPRDPRRDEVATALELAGLRTPPPADLAARLAMDEADVVRALHALREEGTAVLAGDVWFDSANVEAARSAAVAAIGSGARTIGELRDLWGVGRKHALALAGHLDNTGVTRRVGDARVLRQPKG